MKLTWQKNVEIRILNGLYQSIIFAKNPLNPVKNSVKLLASSQRSSPNFVAFSIFTLSA